jgi:hypothetical protein
VIQLVSRPLPKQRTTRRLNTYQTSMPCVGFEPTIPASERAKAVHALALLPWPATMTNTNVNFKLLYKKMPLFLMPYSSSLFIEPPTTIFCVFLLSFKKAEFTFPYTNTRSHSVILFGHTGSSGKNLWRLTSFEFTGGCSKFFFYLDGSGSLACSHSPVNPKDVRRRRFLPELPVCRNKMTEWLLVFV